METNRKLRALWIALAASFAGLAACTFLHEGMDGHMAHPPYPWYSFVLDLGWGGTLALLAAVAVFKYRMPLPAILLGFTSFRDSLLEASAACFGPWRSPVSRSAGCWSRKDSPSGSKADS